MKIIVLILALLAVLIPVPLLYQPSAPYLSARNTVHMIHVGEHGACSGVMIAPHVMLTAGHCVVENTPLTVDGSPAKVIRVDPPAPNGNDLALLVVKAECPCTRLAVAVPHVDSPVIVIGYPLPDFSRGEQVLTEGRSQGTNGNRLILDAPVAPGNSGGGVFSRRNGQWELVGILVEVAALPSMFSVDVFDHLSRAVSTGTMNCFVNALACGGVS